MRKEVSPLKKWKASRKFIPWWMLNPLGFRSRLEDKDVAWNFVATSSAWVCQLPSSTLARVGVAFFPPCCDSQARTLEWVAISSSNAWKWKVKVKSFSRVWLLVTPWTAVHQAPPSMGFSGQQYWSGVPLPSPVIHIYPLNSHWRIQEQQYCCVYISFLERFSTMTLYIFSISFKRENRSQKEIVGKLASTSPSFS